MNKGCFCLYFVYAFLMFLFQNVFLILFDFYYFFDFYHFFGILLFLFLFSFFDFYDFFGICIFWYLQIMGEKLSSSTVIVIVVDFTRCTIYTERTQWHYNKKKLGTIVRDILFIDRV